jgi:hypothetical protein
MGNGTDSSSKTTTDFSAGMTTGKVKHGGGSDRGKEGLR